MYEIKKIVPISLAKYVALILLMLRFFFYAFSLLSDFVSSPQDFRASFTSDIAGKWFIGLAVDLILVYISSFVMTYLFAFIYNRIVRKTKIKGIMVDFKLIENSIIEDKKLDKKEEKDDKFVV